jgi:hypothetical protein
MILVKAFLIVNGGFNIIPNKTTPRLTVTTYFIVLYLAAGLLGSAKNRVLIGGKQRGFSIGAAKQKPHITMCDSPIGCPRCLTTNVKKYSLNFSYKKQQHKCKDCKYKFVDKGQDWFICSE